MNEINNVVEELSYIRQEFEKLNKTLLEIKALLTPTNLTVSTQEIKESDSSKGDLDKIRDILDIHTRKRGGRP